LYFGSIECTRDMLRKSSAGFRFLCSWYIAKTSERNSGFRFNAFLFC
jgi:hypothetical protein